MALIAGELVALLSLDDKRFSSGLLGAERQMVRAGLHMGEAAADAGERAGQQLGDGVTDGLAPLRTDAERIGRQAGDALGEGVVRGVDGPLGALRGRVVGAARRAGDDAGSALGDGLKDSGQQGADAAVGGIGDKLGGLKLAAAGAGAAAGAMLMAAFTETLDQGQITAKLTAQLGATPAQAQQYGKAAG
ncbi:hypothetical protein NGM37_22380, partial [Streptomyces sp. TRM76130]|nr:hypothetical protein [Streptomyces sp. TRM76130]